MIVRTRKETRRPDGS
ncbi:MAG: hypothetical protein ACFN27_04160, partial [Prevotella sp.]